MINKDIKCYFDEEMRDYIDPIKIISLPETQNNTNSPKPPLVNMYETMYNFDKICKNLYKLPPKSADGIFFVNELCILWSLKQGLKENLKINLKTWLHCVQNIMKFAKNGRSGKTIDLKESKLNSEHLLGLKQLKAT